MRARAAPLRVGAAALAAVLASGCSSREIYDASLGWRKNECYKIGDLEQRERCMKEDDRPYDAYRAGQGKTP
jgi:hypothetical protein